MNSRLWAKLSVLMFSIFVSVALAGRAGNASASDQQPQAEKPPAGQAPAGQQTQPQPETLQLLKGMPRQQIIQEMRKMAGALGVECNFCHVNPFSAETPRKSVARLMMRDYTMAMQHKDNSALGCNDCHKGQPNPLRTGPFEGAVGVKTMGLQVLKGTPRPQLMEAMNSFTKALGVECNYCHTSDFDDETPRKQMARFMMTEYARGLTKKDGSAVTCNDCHQGRARPLAVLPFPKREERRPEPQPPAKKPSGFNF